MGAVGKIPQILFREPSREQVVVVEESVDVEPVAEDQVVRAVRRPVLEDSAEVVARTLVDNPGQWYIIARGERDRLKVISQTGYRIRRNQIGAFAAQAGTVGGSWETRVNSQTGRSEEESVLLYGRWVAGG